LPAWPTRALKAASMSASSPGGKGCSMIQPRILGPASLSAAMSSTSRVASSAAMRSASPLADRETPDTPRRWSRSRPGHAHAERRQVLDHLAQGGVLAADDGHVAHALARILVGEIQGVMKSAALAPSQRRLNDQIRDLQKVAQLDEVIADAELAVILNDLLLKQVGTPLGSAQSLVGAHDADIVPHEATQLVPVVGHHDLFVRLGDPAFIPWLHLGRVGDLMHEPRDVLGCHLGVDETLQKRVAGHPVGAVKSGVGGLPAGVEPGQVRACLSVDHHPAAGVVGRRHHRDRIFRDVDPELQAAAMDGREVLDHEVGRSMRDVEVDAFGAEPLHLMVDGACHDVTRRKLGPRIEPRHEALTTGEQQSCTFAAQRFGDQEGTGLRVVETGRVKLHELHVRDPTPGAPGHGDAVASGHIRVAGIEVDLVRASGRQDDEACEIGLDLSGAEIQDVGAETAMVSFVVKVLRGDEVDGDVLLEQGDVRLGPHLCLEGRGDRLSGRISGMDHASMGVSAFAGEVIAAGRAAALVACELDALIEQPVDVVGATLDDMFDDPSVAESGSGLQGVLNMGLDRVRRVQNGRDAALSV
jgi:hypothetical protein